MFEELARDTTSGATALTRRAATLLSETIGTSAAADPGEFWNELTAACRELVNTQREMAPLLNMVGSALSTAERLVLSGVNAETLKRVIVFELESFADGLKDHMDELASEGAAALPACSSVATLSSSECVAAVLGGAARSGRTISILISESRPALEGVTQASRLASLGLPVRLVSDAALPGLMTEIDLVLVGADRVSQDELVGKSGIYPAALAARDRGIPFLAAATEERFVSAALADTTAHSGDPIGLLDTPSDDVSVENRVFEPVPMTLVTGVLTENGLKSPAEVAAALSRKPVAPALLRVLFDRTPPSGL
ncbi:hypothetical protein K8S17_02840 [bacterium]|nr:hypothetical protein [bacterium]